jgi:hypothetical protein
MSSKSIKAAILLTLFLLASFWSLASMSESSDLTGIGASIRGHSHHRLVPLLGHHIQHLVLKSRKVGMGNSNHRLSLAGCENNCYVSNVRTTYNYIAQVPTEHLVSKLWLLFCSLLI